MVSFRFYLVSVTAIFLALAVGITVGATVIDKATVDLLHSQIRAANRRADETANTNKDLQNQLDQRDAFESSGARAFVQGRLTDERVVVAAVHGNATDEAAIENVRSLVQSAGGQVQSDGQAYIVQAGDTKPAPASGATVAAAALAGIVATLALMLALMIVSFAAFFLLGVPALIGLVTAAAIWGTQLGFGTSAPLQVWLAGAGGIALLALALNTGAALPIYWSLVFGSGRRLDRLREAWSGYWSLYRGIVIPACALFGLVVFRLLSGG